MNVTIPTVKRMESGMIWVGKTTLLGFEVQPANDDNAIRWEARSSNALAKAESNIIRGGCFLITQLRETLVVMLDLMVRCQSKRLLALILDVYNTSFTCRN